MIMSGRKFHVFVATMFCYLSVYASDVPIRRKTVFRRLIMPGQKEDSVGDIAANLFSFTQNMGQMFKTVAITTGVAVILFGMIQYNKYRKNSVETPISKVIMTIVIGLSLMALSFIPMKF
ncbi:MAG: hypothetical protein LBL17_01165 [Coxiellaceae bacterium]|jgi:hypothetical protein|nr:hypothetical protein [Coxiellaceae bacterium]